MQDTLSHYRVLEEIGKGGMGVVYRAHDERLDRDVALKVLPAGVLADESARKRFHGEALALSKLNHPNIATVFDFDTQEGTDFLVEELIPGISLSEMLLSGPLPERKVINLGSQLAEGLAAAHDQGIIHRDLKPGNIRVTPDARLKILDFGLAKVMRQAPVASDTGATASITETQTVSGTFPYMAPEQLLNEKLDARTDIWATGCVLYEMATGQRAFIGYGPTLSEAIIHQQPALPSKLNHKIAPGLEAIILKCLEKDPSLRYSSARDIAVDLHRMASAVSTIQVLPQRPRLSVRKIIIALALAAVLALAGIAVWRLGLQPIGSKVAQPAQVTPSIAVLPFTDMSPGKDQEYFSDGLAEELLNDLAKVPDLKVTARTSSFQFKGKNEDLRVIGERLNVATVLEGSVRKQGNRVRITAQLIKVSDGFHMWSETYDRELKDTFAVQEDIARSVAGSLKVALLGAKVTSLHPTNLGAYNAYLQGKYFVAQMWSPDADQRMDKAIAYFEQAIKLDSNYALAWVGLSTAHFWRAGNHPDPLHSEKEYSKAREAAERALALDPNLAEAYVAVGSIKYFHDWDWDGADVSYQRALALEPGNASVVGGGAQLAVSLGRFEEALRLTRRAVELDPLRDRPYGNLAFTAWRAGRLDEAAAAGQKGLELNPNGDWQHNLLGHVYLAQSRPQEALAEAERVTNPTFRLLGLALAYHSLGRKQESDRALTELVAKYEGIAAYQIAEVYAFREEPDAAFQWLERAYIQRDTGLAWVKADPLLKSLEHEPRYAAFLTKLRLPLN